MRKIYGFASSLIFAAAAPAFAQATAPDNAIAPMSARDLVAMPRVGSPIVANDGDQIIYTVTTTDRESLERTTAIYWRRLSDLAAAPVELNLNGDAFDMAFASDGHLYFLSTRADDGDASEGARLWRTRLDDGKLSDPQRVTDFATGISGYAVSPNAKHLAVWGEIARGCATFGCDGDGTAHLPGPGTGRLYDAEDGFYRHWDDWTSPGTYSRIFAFDLVDGMASGDGQALDTPKSGIAFTGNTPTKPFGGGEDIAWSADSQEIYFTARASDKAEPTTTNTDIFVANVAKASLTNLTDDNEAVDTLPVPSPDGRHLAYLAMERPDYESDRLVIHVRDLRTGQVRALTDSFDRSFGSLSWTPDSRYIIATAQDVLDTPAFRIDAQTGAVERLDLMAGNEAHIGGITPLAGNHLLFTNDSIGAPREIFYSENYSQALPVTNAAAKQVGQLASVVTTRFNFPGANGDTVWGQITKLEDHDGPMPAILYVHGGPQGSFNDGWSSRWNPRVVASQGYAVISVDFHGSTGYGQAFTDAINGDWGGKPLEDLQLGLAAALAQDDEIDGTRTCAMGASYGGYMMNWIAGKWPDRFNCLVQHDGLFDMRSFYYTTEELWFPRWDFGGSYAEQSELYEKWNPVNHVDQWQTPMLVITGEKDFRVPYTQGLASFTALQERDIPAQLLVFPDENHWVLKPKNSLQWHNTVFAWLDRWLAKESDAE